MLQWVDSKVETTRATPHPEQGCQQQSSGGAPNPIIPAWSLQVTSARKQYFIHQFTVINSNSVNLMYVAPNH